MLPDAGPSQTYATIFPMVAGEITLPERFFVHPADADARHTVPSLSFLIRRGKNNNDADDDDGGAMLFDLGLRSSITDYTAAQQAHLANRVPHRVGPGVAALLREHGLVAPSDISTVVLSHVHYDHHGDPDHFPSARFVVGPGTKDLLQNGLNTSASHQSFQADLLPVSRLTELPQVDSSGSEWQGIGSFWGLDLFGDRCIYVLNSPGHLPGHVNLLCRTGSDSWVCLCGDSYHDRRLLTGEKDIATWEGSGGEVCCIHVDPEGAKQVIANLRELASLGNVEMISAHDLVWLRQNTHRLIPATL